MKQASKLKTTMPYDGAFSTQWGGRKREWRHLAQSKVTYLLRTYLECFGSPSYHCCGPAFRQVGDKHFCGCFRAPALPLPPPAGVSLIT